MPGLRLPPLHRPPSAAGEVHYAISESGSAVNLRTAHPHSVHGGHGHSGRGAPDLPVPAREHLGHHTHSAAELAGGNGSRHGGHAHHQRTGSSGSVGGSRHGGKKDVQHLKRAGTVVRTIRTLRRKPRAAQPSSAASPGAAEGAAAGSSGPGGGSGEAVAAEGQPLLEQGGSMETAASAPAALASGEPVVLAGAAACCCLLLTPSPWLPLQGAHFITVPTMRCVLCRARWRPWGWRRRQRLGR